MISRSHLLDLVDSGEFRRLFVEELGWNNPDQPPVTVDTESRAVPLTQVAGYKGLRIWLCTEIPDRKTQRMIDDHLGRSNHERLVIFTDGTTQEWRWPRRAQMSGANAKLLLHRHTVGQPDPHLDGQLRAIELDIDDDITLVELLTRMRAAFDEEAETASVQAARLMKELYAELEASGVDEFAATLLLARLLFLLFGDDSGMWRRDMFHEYLVGHTSAETINTALTELFGVVAKDARSRTLAPDSPLDEFRYINGGLFSGELTLPVLNAGFRDALLRACGFDWTVISPAVFGSMFQTVKKPERRRRGGEHYTTEKNILRTIGPLFLDELQEQLNTHWDDRKKLAKLHEHLGSLRFLDPACGCGNFLIVTYRELRALELDLIKRLRDLDIDAGVKSAATRGQQSFDVTGDIKVTLDHFYGIEIEEWPARIAETAMLLVDHLANQRMEQEFGIAPDRLPIRIAPTIVHGSALDVEWATILPPSRTTYVFGNPPFLGKEQRTEVQTAEMMAVLGEDYSGEMDYVASWFLLAARYLGGTGSRFAFVATNSIAQGVVVAPLFRPIRELGWRVKFAHRTFLWETEATDAGVHCVIIGFDHGGGAPRLFDYERGRGEPIEVSHVSNINGYLVAAEDVYVVDSPTSLAPALASNIQFGSMAADGNHLFLAADELADAFSDVAAVPFIRRFVGARELIHNLERWCIWMPELDANAMNRSPLLKAHIDGVAEFRSNARDAAVRRDAASPYRFHRVKQPATNFLCIPRHFAESREYATVAYLSPDVIAGDATFTAADPDGLLFAVMSSVQFMTWQKTVGGRLRHDPRFSSTLSWNSYPFPALTRTQRVRLIELGQVILNARSAAGDSSLADLYDPVRMPSVLRTAHSELDAFTDSLFGLPEGPSTVARQQKLFERYAELSMANELELPALTQRRSRARRLNR